jgi:hypothetical protein
MNLLTSLSEVQLYLKNGHFCFLAGKRESVCVCEIEKEKKTNHSLAVRRGGLFAFFSSFVLIAKVAHPA